MMDATRVVDALALRLQSDCKFKIRDETRCFYRSFAEEIFKEIAENAEVKLKELLPQNGTLEIVDGELYDESMNLILGKDESLLKIV